MPRTARGSIGGVCYHVINRGNARAAVFLDDDDYRYFIGLMEDASERVDCRLCAYCLMPNHFHFVLWPRDDGDMSRWMQWLLTSHVRRHHLKHGSSGHVWQGRFKAFPIQQDEHYLTVMRYVERNPLRAKLVRRAEEWRWSSLAARGTARAPAFLAGGPMPLPSEWRAAVNEVEAPAELARLRHCVNRGTPYGAARWVERIAAKLGLESTLRPPGRPRRE